MDRAGLACLLLALAACAARESPDIRVVPQDCRIALPYNAAEIGECTPRSAAAYDFAFCYVHYLVGSLAAPPEDKAKGEAGLSAQYRRKAIASGKVAQALSDTRTFERNVALTRKYYESLQKQNPVSTGSALEYVRAKCDNLPAHHAAVLRSLHDRTL